MICLKKSIGAFNETSRAYIHYGKTTFNAGLKLELLQEYCLIALDVFRKFQYPKAGNEQTEWLSLLVTESVEEAGEGS